MSYRLTLFAVIIFCLMVNNAAAQNDTKGAKRLYDQAIGILDTERNASSEAIELLQAAIQKDTNFIVAYQPQYYIKLQFKIIKSLSRTILLSLQKEISI